MRQAYISSLNEGAILARSIHFANGNVLLQKGISLNTTYIKRLKALGITTVYIEDELFDDIEIEDILSEKTRIQATKVTKDCMDSIRMGKDFNSANLKTVIESIVQEILNRDRVLLNLTDIYAQNDWLFIHSLNVCILSIIIGIDYKLSKDKLQELAIGALLHDIGVTQLPEDILNKKGKLSPEEIKIYQNHCTLGYNILRKKRDFSLLSSHVALQHHERVDGLGYPRGIKEEEILLYARIVSVCNIYHNLLNCKNNLLPHDAYEIIMGLCGRYFDQESINRFVRNVAIYPTGISVLLNTGEVGVVVDQNLELPQRPIIRIISGDLDEKTKVLREYDLSKEMTVFIQKVIVDPDTTS